MFRFIFSFAVFTVFLILTACQQKSENSKIKTVVENNISFYFADSLVFKLDTLTPIKSSYLFLNHDETEIFSINRLNNSLVVHSLKDGQQIETILLANFGISAKITGAVKLDENQFILSDGYSLYWIDKNKKSIQKKISIISEKGNGYFSCFSPMLLLEGKKLYIPYFGFHPEMNSFRIYDLEKITFEEYLPKSENFKKGNWGGIGFDTHFSAYIKHKNAVFVSYQNDRNLYDVTLEQPISVRKIFTPTTLFDTVPAPYQTEADIPANPAEYTTDLLAQSAFFAVYYDAASKNSFRLVRHGIDRKEIPKVGLGANLIFKHSAVVLDEHGKIVGEGLLPNNADYGCVFTDSRGIWVLLKEMDDSENFRKFGLLKFKKLG